MHDIVTGIGLVLLFVLASGVLIVRENRTRKKLFLQKMKASWGKIPDREYTYEELEHISRYFYERGRTGFFIDDITWNDLDMNRIFILLNQSCSPLGAECLYDMLRKPLFQEEELKERHRLMEFFKENPTIRHQLQALLADIKKPGNVSVFEAIHATEGVELKGGRVQLIHCLGFFLSLLVFMAAPHIGVFLFIGVCVINIISYLAQKMQIDLYLTSFRCVMQLLSAQKELEKLQIPELENYIKKGQKYKKALSGFQRGAALVIDRSSAGGGMEGFIMDYIRMLTHMDLIKFRDMMKIMQEKQTEIEGLLYLFGYLDSMLSVASFREALPYYSSPVFEEREKAYMEVEELYHPLISNPVANSICAKGGILVTGSNASGKSTFLKNIAVNAILAQTVYTCTAKYYASPYLKVMTSMALRDDLQSGESYYIVEIRSLKRILEETEKPGYLLCIIDEVLRGTNTMERIGASSRILGNLCKKKVLPFAATHDIELSYILEGRYKNYHFEEEFGKQDVMFSYLLKEGRVTTRNAIRLLELTGYDKDLVEAAKKAVEEFEKTGIWKNIND